MPDPSASALPWAEIRLFAMDVDGILTDGGLYIGEGVELKRFHVSDGLGLRRLREADLALAWISGRHSPATTRRAAELGIPHLLQNCKDKRAALQALAASLGLEAGAVAYMGDDDVDQAALDYAAIGIAVPEAQEAAIQAADFVTRRPGGCGAVREICELLLAAQPPVRTA